MANGTNGSSLHAVGDDHDTLPPGSCPGPFLCEGLERVITDMGVMRSQMDRIEANQSMLIDEARKISQAIALGVKPK